CEGSGSGSYWQEYAIYLTGVVAFAGGPANALFMFGQLLDAAGNITQLLGQHMTTAAKWFKRAAWQLSPQPFEISGKPKLPGCFGDREWLDRRTKRCKQCGFLAECTANAQG